MKKVFLFLLILICLLAALVVFNTLTFSSKQTAVQALPTPESEEAGLKHFQEALTYKTISFANADLLDTTQFLGFARFLIKAYPLVHEKLSREVIEQYSLLYKWQGKNDGLKPIIIMAHMDVVPIEEATKSMWSFDPFAGTVKDNYIWGRGTTDDKINLIAQLEATEKLLREEFQPERTIYFAFGHDEEVGGKGAIAIAKLLKNRGIEAELILDEGGIITKEKVPGISKPVALLGTAEKGYLSLELTVEKPGGHSSMPEKETSIDILSKALVNLRANPFEPNFSEPMNGFMKNLGPEMPFMEKMAFANPWLFKSLILNTYEKSNTGDAMIRTTAVPTIIHAGIKENVVPTVAKATINFRMLPGDSSSHVIKRVREIINDDRIKIAPTNIIAEASSISPEEGYGFRKVAEAIKKTYPNTLTSPFLLIGATDSRHFGAISKNIIKFSPMIDPIGFHGIDERVSLESFQTAMWFYEQLLRDTK